MYKNVLKSDSFWREKLKIERADKKREKLKTFLVLAINIVLMGQNTYSLSNMISITMFPLL